MQEGIMAAIPGPFEFKSSSFQADGAIPKRHSCEDVNVSPGLLWKNQPKGTHSFALIMDDPDAPAGTFVHWVVFNIPSTVLGLPEGTVTGMQGGNSFNTNKYGGPCPPKGHGQHHYHFTIYALDSMLKLRPGASKEQLLIAMQGHILAQAELIGTYERK